MNRAEKKKYRIEQLGELYNTIENRIEINQQRYEQDIKETKEAEDESDKKYNQERATQRLEENEVLTEILNEIYKMM